MENASKALIMAGSVLLALIIIGALVFMFNSLKGLKTEEATSDEVLKLTEFNRQIETFNRDGVYGSELLSLANLIEDYNIRQSDLKGYEPIKLEIYMSEILGTGNVKYIKATYNTSDSYDQLIKDFKAMEEEANKYTKQVIHGQNVVKWAGLTYYDQLVYLRQKYNNDENKVQTALDEIARSTSNYAVVQSSITEYKNRRFNIPSVEYDSSTGRVSKMVFTQTGL